MNKKAVFIFLMFVVKIVYGQYWMENVTEKSFEKSDIYFNSYYLNPYGFENFKNISPGFIDDPFLNLYLNPANLPELENSTYIYLDFIGERKDPEFMDGIRPIYLEYDYYAPQRYYNRSINASHPEPLISLGILNYPLKNKKLLIGGTYQAIYKKEKFYNPVYNIYNWAYGYDAFGERAQENDNPGYPVIDRYAGKDEMLFNGHFFSLFLGYHLSNKINGGISLNGAIYKKDGIYANFNQYNSNQLEQIENVYFSEKEKENKYQHMDVSAGIRYELTDRIQTGIKIGVLTGKAEQYYSSLDTSFYSYDDNPDNWNYSHYFSDTQQQWAHDGQSGYINAQLERHLSGENKVLFNYGYSHSDIDLNNSSAIFDTSYYAGFWHYDPDTSSYYHHSYLSDDRTATGDKEKYIHRGMVSVDWKVSEKSKVLIGAMLMKKTESVLSNEPVETMRRTFYHHYHSEYYPEGEEYLRSMEEIKRLQWNYEESEISLQIPVQFQFRANKYWQFMFMVNRIMIDKTVKEKTSAIFTRRTENDNGDISVSENFIERYTMPDESYTENKTDVMAGFRLTISPKFALDLKIDPEINNSVNKNFLNIAQWWLSLHASI